MKRMETIDGEITSSTIESMEKAHKDGKPFFVLVQHDPHAYLDASEACKPGCDGLGIYP